MAETVLVCPVCRGEVAPTSSMCLGCHLPIRDVLANQSVAVRRGVPAAVKRVRSALVGLVLYAAVVVWAAYRLPGSLTFMVPGAVAGALLHVAKGRPLVGLAAFLVIVVVLPLLFWPSLLTDFLGTSLD